MLQSIISNKVQKSKQNIETYLSNNPSSQPQAQQQAPSSSQAAARPTQSSTFQSQNNITSSLNKNKLLVKNQVELRMVNCAGKQIVKEGMVFRWSKEEGKFQILFEDEGLKTKVEAKREAIAGKRIKPNYADGTLTLDIKAALIRKEDTKESAVKGTTVYTAGKAIGEYSVTMWFKEKDHLKPVMDSTFLDGLVDMVVPTTAADQPKAQLQAIDEGGDIEEDHGHVKLVAPTASQQGEVQKIRKIIKQMKEQDKTTVLMQVFKIKKQYEDPTSMIKKLKCPVNYCVYCQKKSYKDIQQLKNHLKTKHPELSKHGIELSEYDGTFQYGSKAMDLALFIGKMYPQEMKKIIKQMKTKQME